MRAGRQPAKDREKRRRGEMEATSILAFSHRIAGSSEARAAHGKVISGSTHEKK